MSNDLVKNESMVPDVVNPYEGQLKDITGNVNFLPRLQLFIGNSNPVKEGKIDMNHYGLVSQKEITDMGKEVDVWVFAYRPRAIDASDTNNLRASSDIKSDLFKEIQNTQATVENSGCMWGPDFLVWVPKVEKFATILFGGRSSRNEAAKMSQLLGKAATFKAQLIATPKWKYFSILVTPCTTPFPLPDKQTINEVTTDFYNVKEVLGAELVEEEVTTRTR